MGLTFITYIFVCLNVLCLVFVVDGWFDEIGCSDFVCGLVSWVLFYLLWLFVVICLLVVTCGCWVWCYEFAHYLGV